jgi:hypothetical protein
MPSLIPNRYLFKFEFPLYRWARPLALDGDGSRWDDRFRLPPLHELDGQQAFGQVYAGWDEGGLYVASRVEGKTRPPNCDANRFRQSDNLRVMTDMRDTRDIRRATRFCQQFYFLPTGGGKGGKEPVAGSTPVARAQADAPQAKPGEIVVASKVFKGGWSVTAHIPARVLVGYDPAENPRIGFFAIIEDTELGHQSLTIDDDLNWWCDPSTWPTAVLTE